MRVHFIEYQQDIYVVVGITYITNYTTSPDCFVAVPLNGHKSIISAILDMYTINIPFSEAIEITDKNTVNTLMVLYGST